MDGVDRNSGGKVAEDGGERLDGSIATRFRPGNAGRPRGARNKSTVMVEAMIDGGLEEMTRKIVAQATGGDQAAIRYCLDRRAPARKDVPVEFALPPLDTIADVAEASKQLLAALAAGEVNSAEASRVMALLKDHLALINGARWAADDEEYDEVEESDEAAVEAHHPPRPHVIFLDRE